MRFTYDRKDEPFIPIPVSVAMDKDISSDAKVLYLIIQFFCVLRCDIDKSDVRRRFSGPDNSFRKAWNELIKSGYIVDSDSSYVIRAKFKKGKEGDGEE